MPNKFTEKLARQTEQITDAEAAEYGLNLNRIRPWFKRVGTLSVELQKLCVVAARLRQTHQEAKARMSPSDWKEVDKVTALDMMAADSVDAGGFFKATVRAEYNDNPNLIFCNGWEVVDIGPACLICHKHHADDDVALLHARMGIGPIKLAGSLAEALRMRGGVSIRIMSMDDVESVFGIRAITQ